MSRRYTCVGCATEQAAAKTGPLPQRCERCKQPPPRPLTYVCGSCGLTFDAPSNGPLPKTCPEDRAERNRGYKRRPRSRANNGRGTHAHHDGISPGYALAASTTRLRIAVVLATKALELAVLAPAAGRDPEPWLTAALRHLNDAAPLADDSDLWELAESHAREVLAASRTINLDIPKPREATNG